MGSKYEMTLSSKYVPDWGLNEALREIFQNAYDRERITGVKSYHTYDSATGTLRVVSPQSWLNRSTLLLGVSSKSEDDSQIGQFGEGYKLACLVLTRLGLDVVIKNENFKEVWRPSLKSSRRFSGEEVLIFDVEGRLSYKHTDDKPLEFIITGIAEGDWELYKTKNLNLNPPKNVLESEGNYVLLDEAYAGHVYVSGLYVAVLDGLKYGYNLLPERISLDRDRRTLPTFDILWETSRIWEKSGATEKVLELCREGVKDVEYLTPSYLYLSDSSKEAVVEDFRKEYGNNAYPVTTNEELLVVQQLHADKTPVIVGETYKKVLLETKLIDKIDTETLLSLRGQLEAWLGRVENFLPEEEVTTFKDLVKKVPGYLKV